MEISDRSVACVGMSVWVAMSELTNEELALATPSTMLALIMSARLDALSTSEADTGLDGTSVAEG